MSQSDEPRGKGFVDGRRRAVTIKDVARLSGVSAATVTRALQGHPRVLPATRMRVEHAARTLGYRPDHVARTLRTGRSRTVGLLIPTIRDPFWAEVVEGVEQRAAEEGFSVLLASGHGDPLRAGRMLEVFLDKRVDGIVATASAGAAETQFGEAVRPPVVVVGWDPPIEPEELEKALHRPTASLLEAELRRRSSATIAHVGFDDVGAGELAMRHLLEFGHRRVAFVGGPPTLAAALRLLGVRIALEGAGNSIHRVVPGADTLEGGRLAALRLLRERRRPSAIIAFNDLVAIGALRAAHALGIDVPRSLSVLGFDDIDVAAFVEPTLTTVHQPKLEMGSQAIDLLFERMRGGATVQRERLPGVLVVRESTAPVPEAAL